MDDTVSSAYGRRAQEYTEALGSMDSVSAEDRTLVTEWASTLDGRVVDAGCGPGHWTQLLHDCGLDVVGIDLVPAFIAEAARRFPQARFDVGDLRALPAEDEGLGGVLAWYSVIHIHPGDIPEVLAGFCRALRPGGSLLLGFFRGSDVEPFDHAITTAYHWPVERLHRTLQEAGFSIHQTHTRKDPDSRPHAAIWAVKR